MCGILGYVALKNKRPKLNHFKEALIVCKNRGDDATGFYTPDTGVVKEDIDAEKFVKKYSSNIEEGLKSNLLIAHCRATTQGTEKDNVNNHPHESENYVLVHNGGITKSEPPKEYKLKSKCDSEIILSFIETHGIKKGLEEMYEYDSMAIGLYDKKDKMLYLFRNGNPTSILIDKKDEIIYFGSTSEILKSFFKYGNIFGFRVWEDMISFDSEKEVLYGFSTKEGLVTREEIKQKHYVYSNSIGFRNHSQYSEYQNNYNQSDRMKWCSTCGRDVIKNHTCPKISSSSNSSFIDGNKNYRRSIIYRNGEPRFILNITNKDAA